MLPVIGAALVNEIVDYVMDEGAKEVKEYLNKPNLIFEKCHPNAIIPEYKTKGSAGLDLTAVTYEIKSIEERIFLFNTELKVAIPEGYFGGIYLRSSMGMQGKWILGNLVGIIDSDYRGKIGIILKYNSTIGNMTTATEEAQKLLNTRIAQLVIQPYAQCSIKEDKVDNTERGEGGFGSTGK